MHEKEKKRTRYISIERKKREKGKKIWKKLWTNGTAARIGFSRAIESKGSNTVRVRRRAFTLRIQCLYRRAHKGGRRRPDSGITRTEIFDSRARYSKQATVIFVLRIIIANKRCCYSHDGKERTKNKNFRQRYWKIGVYLSRGERRRT